MERFRRLPSSKYICVPQYELYSVPLEVCGAMVNGPSTSSVNSPSSKYKCKDNGDAINTLTELHELKLEYFVCSICTCKSSTRVEYSKESDNCSDEDLEDEEMEVQDMLNILLKHQFKDHNPNSRKTLLRLVNSFRGHGVNQDHFIQIQDLLDSQNDVVKEAALIFLYKLCIKEEICIIISQHKMMKNIIILLSSPCDINIQSAAFQLLQELFKYKSICDNWCDEVENCILPSILRTYYTTDPLTLKYSATCLLHSLSTHKSTARLLAPEILLILKQFKDGSAMLKVVFTNILVNLYQHQGIVDSQLLDNSLLPTCLQLISDGPCVNQTIAMSLLSSLVKEEKYIHQTINHQHLIPSIINCFHLSDCKRVREAAGDIISQVTKLQQIKDARDFMTQSALYFIMDDKDETIDNKLLYPVRLKYKTDEKLWSAMDKFILLIVHSIHIEGKLMKLADGNMVMDCNNQCNINITQLQSLIHLSMILLNLCSWPVEKEKASVPAVNMTDFGGNDEIRLMMLNLNRTMIIKIWNRAYLQLMAILRKYSKKLERTLDIENLSGVNKTSQSNCLTEKEYELVLNILNIFSYISAAVCQTVKTDEREKSDKGIWIDDNLHLTRSINRSSAFLNKQEEDIKKVRKEGKVIRNELYKQGLIQILSPLLESSYSNLRVMSSFILRCSVQPIEELDKYTDITSITTKPIKRRPQSAIARTNNHTINIALHKMSPQLSSSIQNILGPRPMSVTRKDVINEEKTEVENTPLYQQYRQSAVKVCGPRLLRGIFNKSRDVKKSSLLLIQDLVRYGTVETHMELSQIGCIPKLIDFLRINEDDEMLEISGLILTRMLISSDFRLKQLFNRHGGSNLLMSMAQYAKGKLRDEVRSTLQTITRGGEKPKRPTSAPSVQNKTSDVWDHIMGRWKQEDQVVNVLRKWLRDEENA